MSKRVRKAVRTFLIRDNDIVVIRYKTEKNKDYYDIPGGKIEDKETSYETSVREFMEEVGINILNQERIGHVLIEYPDLIYDFDIFKITNYEGEPKEFLENTSMWFNIDELLNNDKKFPCTEIIKHLDDDELSLKIYSDSNHNVLKVENL